MLMMKTIKILEKITLVLFILFVIGLITGIILLKFTADNEIIANKIIGFSVLIVVFIVVPLFLYLRLRGKKLKDYTLTPENIKKWRDKLDD